MKKNAFIIVIMLLNVCLLSFFFLKDCFQSYSEENHSTYGGTGDVGMGFVISDEYIVTAAHVVERIRDTKNKRVIVYPFVESERRYHYSKTIVAELVGDTITEDGDIHGDVAVLKILGYKDLSNLKDDGADDDNVRNQIRENDWKLLSCSDDELKKELKELPKDMLRPLPFSNDKQHPGRDVCVPGSVYLNEDKEPTTVPFFMYCARVAGREYKEDDSKKNDDNLCLYLDKAVHNGMSGSPVVNSEGVVVALVTKNITQAYVVHDCEFKTQNNDNPVMLQPGSVHIPVYASGISVKSLKNDIINTILGDKNKINFESKAAATNATENDSEKAVDNNKKRDSEQFQNFIENEKEMESIRKSLILIKIPK